MQLFGRSHPKCLVLGFIKVSAEFDDARAEGGYCRILVEGIVVRHVDGRCDAGASGGKRDGLAMIAARRGNDSTGLWMRMTESIQVHESPADFECAGRRVILMFYPHGAAGTQLQLRPGVLRGRRHYAG